MQLTQDLKVTILREVSSTTLVQPTKLEMLEMAVHDSQVTAACSFECEVEPDGWCQHGRPSWLVYWGVI